MEGLSGSARQDGNEGAFHEWNALDDDLCAYYVPVPSCMAEMVTATLLPVGKHATYSSLIFAALTIASHFASWLTM